MSGKKVSTNLLVKTSFWYTVSYFLTHGMAFITIPIFTRLMSKTEFGDFSVYASWQQIMIIICSLEVGATLNRARFDYSEKEAMDSYITSSLVLTTIATGSLLFLYILFPEAFDCWLLIKREYMVVMFAYLFTYPAYAMFIVKHRIEYKYKVSAFLTMAMTIISSILAVVFVINTKSDRAMARITGQYSLMILVGLLLYFHFLHNSRSIRVDCFKYALRIGIPLVFSYLASRILLTSDTIVLKHMCTSEQVSYVSISHSTSQIIMLLVQALNVAWSPWLYDMLRVKDYGPVNKIYSIYLWAITGLTFCTLMIGPEVINILGGSSYRESLYVLPAYTLSGIFTVFTAQFGAVETFYKRPEYSAILTGIVAVLNVILDIIGVKLFGYRAVCYATVFCQVLLIILHYIVTLKMDIQQILSVHTMAAVLAVALLLIPFCLLIYKNDIVRYALITLLAVLVVVNGYMKWKDLEALVQRLRCKKELK